MEQRGTPVIMRFLGKDPAAKEAIAEYPGIYAGFYIYGRHEVVVMITEHGVFHVDYEEYDEYTPWMSVEMARSQGYAVPDGPPEGRLSGFRQEGTPWMWSGPDSVRVFFNDWSTRKDELNTPSQLLGSYRADDRREEFQDEENGSPIPPQELREDLVGAVLVVGLRGE